jgi:hypothetical protein
MSGAWWFLAGWISASAFIGLGILAQHRLRTRGAWLDAQDSEQFASGCERFTAAQGI